MLSYKVVLLALASSALAVPTGYLHRREVPQEHSHEKIVRATDTALKLNNPDGITDAVFGLLGAAAAATGAGKITDADCLQQATADQAFTNAKAAGDVEAMTNALIFRALERNSGAVGQLSPNCTSITATNPEIAALTQHQDPASDNAAAFNKGVTLELARQIASIGGDPQRALDAGTFAPGTIGDPTAKGNSCDDANDPVGCAFTQNLIVDDATAEEIDAAVAGVASGDAGAANNASNDTGSSDSAASSSAADSSATASATASADCTASTVTVTETATETAAETASATTTSAAAATTSAATDTETCTDGSTTNNAALGDADFGSCTAPSIEFGAGFDGRKETSFQPTDKTSFNHGSAQNIGIIVQFECDQLTNSCKANQAAKDLCAQAQTAVAAADPKAGATADLFNSFFGETTNFADVQAIDDQGRPVASTKRRDLLLALTRARIEERRALFRRQSTCTSASASATSAAATATSAAADSSASASSSAAASATTSAAAATTSAASTSGDNLQTFTDGLGGATAPAVRPGGRGFQVDGSDDFLNVGAALGRSCDIQHNACANLANGSAKGQFTVGDCDTQNNQCHAAIQ